MSARHQDLVKEIDYPEEEEIAPRLKAEVERLRKELDRLKKQTTKKRKPRGKK